MAQGESLMALSNQMADVVDAVAGSVVQVRSGRWRPAAGTVCLDEHVLTAEHTLEHEEEIVVRDADGRILPASFIGRDPSTGLALLKVAGLAAPPVQRSKTAARTGQVALAVGRGWSGGIVAGLGVVSSVGGPWRGGRGPAVEQVIRTDATPYPGFAGGALVGADGSCLGITTGILLRGLGLVIPASGAWPVAETLARDGRIRRPFLGVSGQRVRLPRVGDRASEGAILVIGVADDSPAQRAGLMIGDILLAFDGHEVEDPETLLSLLSRDLVDRTVRVEILRAGDRRQIGVTLTERPAHGE
jgi:S1-C subfamily serine protease